MVYSALKMTMQAYFTLHRDPEMGEIQTGWTVHAPILLVCHNYWSSWTSFQITKNRDHSH